jgi:hypothetical protein
MTALLVLFLFIAFVATDHVVSTVAKRAKGAPLDSTR